MIEAIPASNDVNLPGLATTETLTRHVNLNYFSEAVSVSIQTTERYLGCKQRFRDAVNDHIGVEPDTSS